MSAAADMLARILSETHEDRLWPVLEEAGFPDALTPDGGLTLAEGVALAEEVGRAAAPVPLVETMLARRLSALAGLTATGVLTLTEDLAAPRDVPFGAAATGVVGLIDGRIAVADIVQADPTPLQDDDTASLTVRVRATSDVAAPLRPLAAAMRAAQMTGAMLAALDLTLDHVQTREQFGRPLSKFQAIQHHLADIAAEVAAASAATAAMADALDGGISEALPEIATAKIRCGMAAGRVASLAHQCHGAIGFTADYALGARTRRLWRWRDEFGDETHWADRLGRHLSGAPLWPQIASETRHD